MNKTGILDFVVVAAFFGGPLGEIGSELWTLERKF